MNTPMPIADKKELEIMSDLEYRVNTYLYDGDIVLTRDEINAILFFLAKASTGQPSFTEHIRVAEEKAEKAHKEWLRSGR